MVDRKNIKKYALISVYNKSKLRYLCANLKNQKISIISTGSTCEKIKKLGCKCTDISSITKFKEILDGRVKTIHPKIHASLLFKRNSKKHIATFNKLQFPIIDFVIVNLYPFEKTITSSSSHEKILEMIDIGGTTLLRSASKNFESVTTISSPDDYEIFVENLIKHSGKTSLDFRAKMAFNAFKKTSSYDEVVYKWIESKKYKKNLNKKTKKILKYGENPNQKSYFFKKQSISIPDCQIHGKKLSYNNILDISDGLSCIAEFKEPTCVIIKHNNPCGVSSASNLLKSFLKAHKSDSTSAYGGIAIFNKKINQKLARRINKQFFEIIIAPSFDKESGKTLKLKKNLILIETKKLLINNTIESRSVNTGVLFQDRNKYKITNSSVKKVSINKENKKIKDDLIFAYKVVKHVKSNAIVLVKNKQTLAIGAGQMNRLDSTKIAINKYINNFPNKKFVCASDAFFPFNDSIRLLKKNNCLAIIQPSGSKNDENLIKFANQNKMGLYFAKYRVFKH